MALQLETTITTIQGFEVENAYGRVLALDNFNGIDINSAITIYVSKDAYTNGAQPLDIEIVNNTSSPYNRDVDGSDILSLAHDYLIQLLADQGITAVKLLS